MFLSDPVDTYYKNRRDHATVISLACESPEETCFCTAFGIDAAAPEGDVAAWKEEGFLYLKAQSEKGETLLKSLDALLTDADEKDVEKFAIPLRTVVTVMREEIHKEGPNAALAHWIVGNLRVLTEGKSIVLETCDKTP